MEQEPTSAEDVAAEARKPADSSSARPLSVVVVGASGDLARKKVFPALFSLYSQGLLPENTHFYGLARSRFLDWEFRAKLMEHLTCRYVPKESCEEKMEDFLSRCFYHSGPVVSSDSFVELYRLMRMREGSGPANRLFYMSIPPFLFLDLAKALGDAGLVDCGEETEGWSRAVIEKPFGHDRPSSDTLVKQMRLVFTEKQTYRIDHFLGKEVIQNLMVLRFANRVFEPVWNREHIRSVEVSFKEDFGIGDRGGYLDQYGIIRDVMQNHLLQILALLAMDKPAAFRAREIRGEKVRLLRSIPPPGVEDLVLGQYHGSSREGTQLPGYLDEPGVPKDSLTPTFAAAVLRIENERWRGVPFLLRAGKALETRATEIRVRFRPLERNIFPGHPGPLPPNELLIRVQPDEAIYLRILNKVPGQEMVLVPRDLRLQYRKAFSEVVPEAYESLLLDVIEGDKSLFIGAAELQASWEIFTPVLHAIAERAIKPILYPAGSKGPAEADGLAARYGIG